MESAGLFQSPSSGLRPDLTTHETVNTRLLPTCAAGLLDSDEVSKPLVRAYRYWYGWTAGCESAATVDVIFRQQCLCVSSQYLVVTDNSPSVADQLRRMMAWETIGGLAVFWR